MRYFLTIREGDAPADSYPIFATADQEIIEVVVKTLARKLAGTPGVNISVLKKHTKVTKETSGDGGGK
jgi:hypothetical protein